MSPSAPPILEDLAEAQAALGEALAVARNVVVLTGAGISTESGIPDFRSPGGLWSRMQPIEYDAFLHSEAARLTDWQRRFEMAALFAKAEPNHAHVALANLAHAGKVSCVITQNVDGLHRRAGAPPDTLIELHGTGTSAHCLSCGEPMGLKTAQEALAREGRAPRCLACNGLVKAAVVSFGEGLPADKLERAIGAARQADLFIAAGTSLIVYPAAALPKVALDAGARLVIASKLPTELDTLGAFILRTPISATFAPFSAGIFE